MTTAQAAAMAKRDAEPMCQLYAAIATVMARVERLKKADNNSFAKYKFTSVDDFKDHIRPLLAENGLTIRTDEVEFDTIEFVADNSKKSLIARYKFAFSLAHVSGAVEPAEHSTVSLPYTGAQTTGAARSYAIKEWLKSKFLASSGDPDPAEEADTHEQRGYSKTLPKAKGRAVYERLSGELRMLASKKAFDTWYATNKSDIDTLPEDWQALLRQEAHDKLLDLKANGNGAPKAAPMPPEMEPNPRLRRQLADSAYGDGYDKLVADWEGRLTMSKDEDERLEIWCEVEAWLERGHKMFPPDLDKLRALVGA